MIEKRKIAFFLPSLAGGGAQRALIQIANEFSMRGIQTDFLVGNISGPYIDEISTNINVVDLKKKRVLACLLPIIRYLHQVKPSHLITTMMYANVAAIIACKLSRSGTKVIARESNVPEVWNEKPLSEGKSLLLKAAELFYPHADAVVCVSFKVEELLSNTLKLDKSLTSVIFNPVVSEDFFSKAAEQSSLPSENLPQRDYVVAVGRLDKVKGFDVLLKAFANFRKYHSLDLLILGEGPEREELTNLAESLNIVEDVYLPGFTTNPYPLMKGATLFVMSSRHEGLPNALIQAIALSRPVVATDICPPEILSGNRYGITVPVDDPIRLSEAMVKVVERDSWPQPDEQWFSRFSADSICNDYLHICGIHTAEYGI